MPAGRPTIYTTDMPAKVWEYLDTTGSAKRILPTVEGFGIYLGINHDTLNEWCKIYPELSASRKEVMDRQAQQLMQDGMYGEKVFGTMAIFLLKVNHDKIEKSATDITTQGQQLQAPMIIIDTYDTEEGVDS